MLPCRARRDSRRVAQLPAVLTIRSLARLLPVLVAGIAALCAASPAVANEPFWTQRPDLTLQGNRLYASNGGWSSYSGDVQKNLYRFLRDGVVVKGLGGTVPKSTTPGVSLPGVTPDDPDAPYYTLTGEDAGHCFTAEVWGGIRSTYYTADGTLVYDVWEWGHLNVFGQRAVTNPVCVGGTPEPPPPPPPPAEPPAPPFVYVPPISLGPQTLRGARANLPWSQQLVAIGGSGSYTFSLVGGTLPNGISLGADGMLSGTPDAPAGRYPFTFGATDAGGRTASLEVVFTVLPPRVSFVTTSLRTARVGKRYGMSFEVTGGSSLRTFSVVAGRLPKGVVLDAGGALSGRPRKAGRYGFTVEVRDANGVVRRHFFSLLVR